MNFNSYRLHDPIYEIILTIINAIRNNKNYAMGAKIAVDNNITLTQIVAKTLKLDIFDIAKLADAIKKLKTT
jgi:hypothetical protein